VQSAGPGTRGPFPHRGLIDCFLQGACARVMRRSFDGRARAYEPSSVMQTVLSGSAPPPPPLSPPPHLCGCRFTLASRCPPALWRLFSTSVQG
jgi:hypothetical protein